MSLLPQCGQICFRNFFRLTVGVVDGRGMVAIPLAPSRVHFKNASSPQSLTTNCLVLGFRGHRLILASLPHGVGKRDINGRRLQRHSQHFRRTESQCLQVLLPFTRTLHDNQSIHLRRAGPRTKQVATGTVGKALFAKDDGERMGREKFQRLKNGRR
jgi:hypothetical protein